MAFATFVDVIITLVLRPQTITDGIGLELLEMEHTESFQQGVFLVLCPMKDRDQWDLQGSLLLSDEGES